MYILHIQMLVSNLYIVTDYILKSLSLYNNTAAAVLYHNNRRLRDSVVV